MTSLAARRLSAVGWRVWVRDLLGCGDSSGDFGDASWKAWVDDLKMLVDEAPLDEPLWLWGVRGGALLLPELLARRPDANILLWQPVISGRSALTQFLRLKTVAAALAGRERIEVNALRASLISGQAVEVAGYRISPSLAAGLEAASLTLPHNFRGRVVWLEVAAGEPTTLAPAGEALRNEWIARGLVGRRPGSFRRAVLANTGNDGVRGIARNDRAANRREKLNAIRESALWIDCEGAAMLGVLTQPPRPTVTVRIGVLIVVGGPQYRVGSHRQFTLLARRLAAQGYPTLRFDYRGMGDSGGERRRFTKLHWISRLPPRYCSAEATCAKLFYGAVRRRIGHFAQPG